MGPWDPPSSYSTPLGSPPSHGPRGTAVTLGSPHPSFPLGFPSLMPLPAGHCWVHSCCAAWSAGVEQDTAGLTGVGRAVFSGISQVSGPWGSGGGRGGLGGGGQQELSLDPSARVGHDPSAPSPDPCPLCLQKCEHCQRLGATIPCRAAACPHFYHFPCAAASGSFQSMKTLRLLCPEHLGEAVQMGACWGLPRQRGAGGCTGVQSNVRPGCWRAAGFAGVCDTCLSWCRGCTLRGLRWAG